MNKHLHRLIFNHARGLRMAVQETATGCGKGRGATGSACVAGPAMPALHATLKPLLAALLVGAGTVMQFASLSHAQIVADPSAPGNQRATVLAAPNGVPLVNITTPSAAGVSRGIFIQFDVDPQGAILNNARTNAQTQLGGWVPGNPWLAGGAARVILNEVNSSNPSQLRGFVEVAGSRAEVVIANPAGVNINGGGFINASRVTITTGTPVINGGNLEAYVVQKGLVTVNGAGLDSSQTDFTGIIARAVEVNAGIWAKDLKVTTGANQVNADQSSATAIAGSGSTPSFALDVSQLGGMYAGKIMLVGTEAGLGVRNAGTLGATAGQVFVTADGMLQNSGRITSTVATSLDAGGGISNTASGTIYSTGDTSLSSRGNITNAGVVAAQGNTTLAATGLTSEVTSSAGSVLAAGLREDGTLPAPAGGTGGLSVSASQAVAALGQNLSASAQSLSARSINLAGSQTSADTLSLAASAGGIDASSAVIAVTQGLTISTPGLLRTDAAKVSAGQLTVSANALSNIGGEIVQSGNGGTADLTVAGQLNNALGVISATGTLNIKDPTASNGPAVNAAAKTLSITNTGGTLIAGQALAIDAASLSSDGKLLSQGSLSARLLGNHTHSAAAQFQAAGDASLETTGTLTNQGQLLAGQGLTLKAASLDNQAGAEIRGTAVKLIATDANTLTNRGLIDGVETVIETVTLNNLGTGRIYGDHVAIGATTVNNLAEGGAAPVIAARNRLDIGATTINSAEHALLFSGGDMAIGGGLDGAKRATGQASTLNNGSATIEALGNLSINAAQINNTNNHFSTQVVLISSADVTEYQGSGSATRYAAGTPGLTTYDDESLHLATPDGGLYEAWSLYQYTRNVSETVVAGTDPGQILSGGSMTINAANVLNDKSRIMAGGPLASTIDNLTNTEVAGSRIVTESGIVTSYWRNHKRGRDDTGSSSASYDPGVAVLGINLTPTVYDQNTAPVGTGTSINARILVAVGQGASVATGSPNTNVPNNSLFRTNPNAAGGFFIETDPRFANYRLWLSSDYMLQQLNLDPSVTQKRLGDGFYEQKLIREQVAELTGRRFLDGYQSDEAQYQALMTNSITFAQQYSLRPGIALSAAQMAQLTSDIVWLVERDVTLPDGTKIKALVPQVYARVKDGDLTGDGALISASAVNLNLSGDLLNSGTIAGRTAVVLNAENVQNLAGRIRGANVAVAATNDLNNIGGQIIAADTLTATAGRDLNVASTTSTQTGATGNRTNIDRVAGLYVSNPGGTLVASAGRDLNLVAAAIQNQGSGNTVIAAGNNLNLGTVLEASSNAITWNANNFRKDSQSAEVGSVIQGAGNVTLSAGNDLNARAAQLTGSQGALTASAGNNVSITAGESRQSVDEGHQSTSKGFLSKKTITTRETMERTDAIGSSLSGNTITVLAGQDIRVQGSSAVSDSGTTLVAGNNLTIEAAQNTFSSTSLKDEKKSGIFSGGGLSITAGKQQQSTDQQNTRATAAASTVGSIGGDVVINAGEAYKQVGSDVLAPAGDISISAKKVDIIEARETSKTVTEQKFKQSGLTLAITAPVITALQTAQQMSQAAGQTNDGRMQALAAATTALAAKNAYDSVAADPAAAGGLNISLTIGGSQNQSTSTASSNLARGSTVAAGGDVSIVASGAGKDSDILVRGSTVQAGNNATLIAEDEIKLLAAANSSEQNRSSSGSSGGIGVAFTVDSGGIGFGITANASASKGKGEGQDTSWTNTRVEAGRELTLLSGGDTTLKGAVAKAETVIADVGGNLNIESLQDTSTYRSKDQSLGGSVTVGIGFSGSVNVSQQKINSDFASVMEQSGIKAGDGGFQVNVQGNTDLKGAVIASTDKAVADGKNAFTTGTLTQSEIQNRAEYSASSLALGGGYSDGKGLIPVGGQAAGAGSPPPNGVGTDADGKAQTGAAQTPGSTLPGYNGFSATIPIALSASGNASSTTGSGISAGAITISDEKKQQALTGQSAAQVVASIDTNVRSDKDATNALKPIFNEQEIKAGFEITGAFARETGTFLANRAKDVDAKRAQADAAERQATDSSNNLTDGQRVALLTQAGQLRADAQSIADNWGPGGTYRQITTALAAAAGGNVSAASGEFVQSMVVSYVQQQGAAYVGKLVADGALIEGSPAHAALQAMVACAGAAASGQSCASGAGGAAAASLLTNLFADSTPNETQSQKEAKRNLLISLVTGISAASGGNAATAANAATSATDNNWLATQQKVQMTKELDAATSLLDKAKITAKWTYVSGKQDVLIAQGVGKGLADAGWSDIKGMAAFLSDPAKGLAGLKEIINSPEARQQMGDVAFRELDAQIDRMQTALQIGGDQNAEQFGLDVGSLVWRVGSIVTGAGGLAKGGIALTKAGINVGVDGLQAMKLTATLLQAEGKGLGGVANLAEIGMEFGGGIAKQGKPFEAFVQTKLPAGTLDLNTIKNNFSTFDHLTPEGIAVSDKTLDTLTKTYTQRPASITSTLNGYVDDMVGFPGDGKGEFILTNAKINGKEMQLGIPYNATADQMAAIAQSVQYARTQGIKIIVTKVK